MIPADLALAQLINRTAAAYATNPPAYITYVEHTHVVAASLGRTQDIDRSVKVRVKDNAAVMQDLPNGGERTGQAFPIIPYFDPFSAFDFSYFANLKRIDITLDRADPYVLKLPPDHPDAGVLVAYFSVWNPSYAPDSTNGRTHFVISPTSTQNNGFYPSDVVTDPATGLPSHIEMRTTSGDEVIELDYAVLEGHWLITHGSFTSSERVGIMAFNVVANVTYDQIAFPATSPDPRI